MDRVTRAILAIAIAILFPVLIYFTANTFLPDKKMAPTDLGCSANLDYGACNYDNYSPRERNQERGVMRAGLAISLSLVGLVGALALRRIPEVLVGLTTGGSVATFGAVTFLATVHDPASEPVYQFVFWLAVFAFLALVSIVYTADHSLPRPLAIAAPKPKKATPNT